MTGNRIELWGRLLGEPEVRVSPRGTTILRITVDCTSGAGEALALGVVMTGQDARQTSASLKSGDEIRVTGCLHSVKRRLRSGMTQTALEVVASSIEGAKQN